MSFPIRWEEVLTEHEEESVDPDWPEEDESEELIDSSMEQGRTAFLMCFGD